MEVANNNQNNKTQQQIQKIEFTNEEKKILKECRDEAFFKRSLPLVVITSFLLGLGFKRNVISNNHKVIKSLVSTTIAYIAGKMSYFPECREKVKSRLPPESNLYQYMVENRIPIINDAQPQESVTTVDKPQNLNSYDELRQRNRINQEQSNQSNSSLYDELRMRNRGIQDVQKKQEQYNDSIFQEKQQEPAKSIDKTQSSKPKLNKFGDIIYEEDAK